MHPIGRLSALILGLKFLLRQHQILFGLPLVASQPLFLQSELVDQVLSLLSDSIDFFVLMLLQFQQLVFALLQLPIFFLDPLLQHLNLD